MNNSDMPANAIPHHVADANNGAFKLGSPGLTKREHFAGLAMQAYMTGCLSDPEVMVLDARETATEAIAYADALLKALEETK